MTVVNTACQPALGNLMRRASRCPARRPHPSPRDDTDRTRLARMVHLHPDLQTAVNLAQDFAVMLRHRLAERLDAWLERAANSALPAFHRFVAGLCRDYNAVKAGLALPWSQGQTEGQVNRLKFLKCQSFGRANFDLLRLRVLFEG